MPSRVWQNPSPTQGKLQPIIAFQVHQDIVHLSPIPQVTPFVLLVKILSRLSPQAPWHLPFEGRLAHGVVQLGDPDPESTGVRPWQQQRREGLGIRYIIVSSQLTGTTARIVNTSHAHIVHILIDAMRYTIC